MSSNSTWTWKQNRQFEDALAVYDRDAPDFWENLAGAVTGKTVEEVKRHYLKLLQDINHIESGKVPVPNYKSYGETINAFKKNDNQERLKNLNLQ